jgi:hypothetical protein
MKPTLKAVSFGLALAACAHAPPPEQQRNENLPAFFLNQPLFDLAVCAPPPQLPTRAQLNEGSLLALLLEQRPQVLECLVPAEHRGPGALTQVKVETRVEARGVVHRVDGENLSDAGRACIEDVLRERLPLRARPAPLRAVAGFTQPVGPAESLFEPNDQTTALAATLRRALPTWCGCYAGHLAGSVPTLEGSFGPDSSRAPRTEGRQRPVSLRFSPELPEQLAPLAACLAERAQTLPYPSSDKARPPRKPLRLRHLNTAVLGASAVLQPELHFHQVEGERNLRAAEAARAWGRRLEAAQAYSERVARYEASKDPERIGELQWRCALVVQASRAWVTALERQREEDGRLEALVTTLAARDTVTPQAHAAVAEAKQRTVAAMRAAEQVLREDEAACPQSHEEPAGSASN